MAEDRLGLVSSFFKTRENMSDDNFHALPL